MVRQVIPEGLATMVPGPELSALLAGIDIHAVTGSDLVEVLCARSRQLAHDQAQLLATVVEVGLCDPATAPGEVARLSEAPPYAADEIRAALAWTRVAADRELHFAETLVTRLPAVFTALDAGVICRSKAWLFAGSWHDSTPDTPAGNDALAGDDVPAGGGPEEGAGPADTDRAPALRARVGVEVRVGLSTLLGQDRHPGEVPGWGPVTAEVARTLVTAQRGAQWRFAVTDPDGQLLLAGITRRRPHTAPTVENLPPCRGGIVELHVPATLLTDLTTDPAACGEWAGVITDIAAQYRTLDHAYGGLTTEINTGPMCRHDHRLKHVGG